MIRYVFFFLFIAFFSRAQESILPSKIAVSMFNDARYSEPVPRTLLKSKSSSTNPFYFLSSRLMYLYQNLISEQIQADCLYEISCSQFTKKMIEKRGLILGTFIGFHQLNNCQGNALLDYPNYKISENDKILNHCYFE
jgi:putative component of membrane protein insertase Oxa1/YidC/SpoIIIJ protein YidD